MIAVGLVLSAVFVPCAFISGMTGQFFRQFALTIAASTIISAFNSLTLSPALSAVLLRARDKETHEPLPRLFIPLAGGWAGYAWLTPILTRWLDGLRSRRPARVLPAALAGCRAAAVAGRPLAGWLAGPPGHRRPELGVPRLQRRLSSGDRRLCRRRRRLDPRRRPWRWSSMPACSG